MAVDADRAQSADEAEFAAWMSARQPALLRTAYLLTGEHHAAEDLVATTLAKVYLNWNKVRDRGALDGYARRVLVNEHNSVWRRSWKRREVTTDEVPEWVGTRDRYDEGQTGGLWELVQSLPRKQRAVIVLRYYEELSEAETADALGVSVGTVKSQASRALASLRQTTDRTAFSLGEEDR